MISSVSKVESLELINSRLPIVKEEIKAILGKFVQQNDMNPLIANRVISYYTECLDYNILGGKLGRARAVVEAHAMCSPAGSGANSVYASVVLGWAVEILQAFFLMEDDVMDKGEFRRGNPCWYKLKGVANGINDGLLLEQALYELISTNEYTRAFSIEAHSILRHASLRTVIGQHLDTCPPLSVLEYTRDQWLSVVRYKTAFYTFLLPCELGILVSGKKFTSTDTVQFREITLLIGELFQCQDDYLDCFGDSSVIGKIGRDIEERKCTWLWYTAIEVCPTESLRNELVSLYSLGDNSVVDRVKEIYTQIGIHEEYTVFCERISKKIQSEIEQLEAKELQNLSNWMLEYTVNRTK